MKENEWGLVFNGFIDMDPIEQELTGFINYVKNDLKDDLKKVYPTMLVVAKDEEQATLFAQGVANILKKEGLISYYVNRPSFLWDKPISDNFDCVLVNDFDNKSVEKNSLDIISKRIVRSPFNDRLNMVTIFYTTKERAEQYKAFYKEDYYKLFESRITLKPYTIQNIAIFIASANQPPTIYLDTTNNTAPEVIRQGKIPRIISPYILIMGKCIFL